MAGLFLRASKSVATGRLSVLEDPRSADFVRASFDGVATVPVAHGAAFSLHGFDVRLLGLVERYGDGTIRRPTALACRGRFRCLGGRVRRGRRRTNLRRS